MVYTVHCSLPMCGIAEELIVTPLLSLLTLNNKRNVRKRFEKVFHCFKNKSVVAICTWINSAALKKGATNKNMFAPFRILVAFKEIFHAYLSISLFKRNAREYDLQLLQIFNSMQH